MLHGISTDVRDSKHRSGPVLSFSPLAWRSFVDGVVAGRIRPIS
ncbi:DUF397 domain-containing protein [Crossiella sp. SN42]|nr:DUF397 domain-containing protein [Crossiella sp. SN42]